MKGMDESESEDSLYLTVVSETERVPLILERVAVFARRQGFSNSDGLLLVVRELLMNAIRHGNESVRSKLALVRIAQRGGRFEVQVDDEGRGFDYESLVLGLPDDPQSLAKRGLVLVHELSEELVFEHGGSRVRAIVCTEGKRPAPDHETISFLRERNNREESCTSPMAKSL
jgi:anti-sigma regulatory factor (Ser/Thr protein kinase)